MAEGPSTYTLNKILDAIGNNTSFAVAQCYMQLHVGAPGAAGTSNVATETTRKSVSEAAAALAAMENDADIEWTVLPTADPETYTFWSLWDAPTGGNFLWSGPMTANAVSDGDSFTIPPGSFVLSGTPAS